MWAGEHINITEDRAVMHMALRYLGDKPVKVDGKDVMPDVRDVLARMEDFSDAVRDGDIAARPASSSPTSSISASAAPTSARPW